MGFFDDLLKQVDKGIKAVEDGKLEERLHQFADTVEKRGQQAEDTIKRAADKPGEVLKAAQPKKD